MLKPYSDAGCDSVGDSEAGFYSGVRSGMWWDYCVGDWSVNQPRKWVRKGEKVGKWEGVGVGVGSRKR